MLNVFILEDQTAEQEQLIGYLHQIQSRLHIRNINIQTFASLDRLTRHLPYPSPENVYILDLEIDGNPKAGLEISKVIRENDAMGSIIFLTVHDELLYTTYKYQVEALDFIAKNYHTIRQDLTRDFEKILEKQTDQRSETITIKSNNIYSRIQTRKIMFFQSNPSNTRQSYMYTINNQRVTVSASLKDLEEVVPHFFRSQRSYLINLDNVQKVDIKAKIIYFRNSQYTVPLSRLKVRKLISILDEPHRQNIRW
ncbi:MAG: LytR/AlgR family response regulator transcription factor [Limosilactobacillus sp.]